MANAQLEALRLENRHLRRTTLSRMSGEKDQSMTDIDIAEAETHLRELQSAYTSSVSSLEVCVLNIWSLVSCLVYPVYITGCTFCKLFVLHTM